MINLRYLFVSGDIGLADGFFVFGKEGAGVEAGDNNVIQKLQLFFLQKLIQTAGAENILVRRSRIAFRMAVIENDEGGV